MFINTVLCDILRTQIVLMLSINSVVEIWWYQRSSWYSIIIISNVPFPTLPSKWETVIGWLLTIVTTFQCYWIWFPFGCPICKFITLETGDIHREKQARSILSYSDGFFLMVKTMWQSVRGFYKVISNGWDTISKNIDCLINPLILIDREFAVVLKNFTQI